MVTAAIKIDGSLGSRSDLSLGSPVTLTNANDVGATSWLWEIVSSPPGSSASLTFTSTPSTSFTPDVVGSYLIQLTVNGTAVDKRIAAVRTPYLNIRIPASEESTEFDEAGNTSGWSASIHEAFVTIDSIANLQYLTFPEQSSDPVALADRGHLYVKDDSGDTELFYRDDSGNVVQITKDGTLDPSSFPGGNTLDASYNEGGSGAGRIIGADAGPVEIQVESDNYGLYVQKLISTAASADRGNIGSWWESNADDQFGIISLLDPRGNSASAITAVVDSVGALMNGTTPLASGKEVHGVSSYVAGNPSDDVASVSIGHNIDILSPSGGSAIGLYIASTAGLTAWDAAIHVAGGPVVLDGGPIRFGEQLSDPTAVANKAFLYVKDDGGDTELFYRDDSGNIVQITSDGALNPGSLPGGNTLDAAYDEGGAGAGRTIIVDSGAVTVNVAADNTGLTVAQTYGSTLNNPMLSAASTDLAAGTSVALVSVQDAVDDNRSIQSSLTADSGLSSGDIVYGVVSSLTGSVAGVGSEMAAFAAQTDSSTLGTYIGFLAEGAEWNIAFKNESGEIQFDGGAVRLAEQTSDPTAVAYKGFIYVKDDAGDIELFYRDSSGNIVQITQDGALAVTVTPNTLGGAYNQGGAGAGRQIVAGSGPVQILAGGAGSEGLDIDGYATSLAWTFASAVTGDAASGIRSQLGPTNLELYFSEIGSGGVFNDVQITKYGLLYTPLVRLPEAASDPTAESNDGYLYSKDDAGDTELHYMDDSGNVVQITKDGALNIGAISRNDLNGAYHQGGFGLGRFIYADFGPVVIDAYGNEALNLDGYIGMEDISDPNPIPDKGIVYVKQVGGNHELHFMDQSGSITQVTDDGYLNTYNSLRGVGLFKQGTDPSTSPTKGFVYTKDDAGVIELFYRDDSGNVIQITRNGSLDAADKSLLDAYATPSVVDGYALTSSLSAYAEKSLLDSYATPNVVDGYAKDFPDLSDVPSSYSGQGEKFVRVKVTEDGLSFSSTCLTDGYLAFPEKASDPGYVDDYGGLYTKNDDEYGTTELFYIDDSGQVTQITQDGYLATYNSLRGISMYAVDEVPTPDLDKLSIFAKTIDGRTELICRDDSGAETQITSQGQVNVSDGYLKVSPVDADPIPVDSDGYIYSKEVDGYAELHYMDNYGLITRVTNAGSIINGTAIEEELDPTTTDGSETSINLTYIPVVSSSKASGRDINVYRNGVLLRHAAVPSTTLEWKYNSSLNRVEFVASGSPNDWYLVVYRS